MKSLKLMAKILCIKCPCNELGMNVKKIHSDSGGASLPSEDFKDARIRVFSSISLIIHFREKCFEQKLFLIEFHIKMVSCKICVQSKGEP